MQHETSKNIIDAAAKELCDIRQAAFRIHREGLGRENLSPDEIHSLESKLQEAAESVWMIFCQCRLAQRLGILEPFLASIGVSTFVHREEGED